jgi:hypothetical protein
MLEIATLAATIIVLSSAAHAQHKSLQPPVPGTRVVDSQDQQIPTTRNQPAADNQRSTPTTPLIIKITNPPNGDSIATEIKKNRDEQAAEDRHLATFNKLLVAVSIFQAIALGYTALVTNKAANAARTAADAIPIMERPYVFIYGVSVATSAVREYPYISYCVANHGRLAAIIQNITVRCGVIDSKDRYPPKIIIGDHELLQASILTTGREFRDFKYEPVRSDVWNFSGPLRNLKDQTIFQVTITYKGPFTKNHKTAQCWRYNDRTPRGFIEVDDPRYTYTR